MLAPVAQQVAHDALNLNNTNELVAAFLMEKISDGDVQDMGKTIRQTCSSIGSLLRHMSSFAREDSYDQAEASGLVKSVITDAAALATARGIRFESAVSETLQDIAVLHADVYLVLLSVLHGILRTLDRNKFALVEASYEDETLIMTVTHDGDTPWPSVRGPHLTMEAAKSLAENLGGGLEVTQGPHGIAVVLRIPGPHFGSFPPP
jgi:phosphoglycerate-specific signal transduction histidine kinase